MTSAQRRPARLSPLHDERGIVLGFMVRLLLVITVLGVVFLEGGAILFSKLQAQDVAESAAVAGAGSLFHNRSQRVARSEAELRMRDKSPRAQMTSFVINPDGSVSVTVRVPANTLLIQHVDFLETYTSTKATATARPPHPDV